MKTAAAFALLLFTTLPACKKKDAAAPPPPVGGKGSAAPPAAGSAAVTAPTPATGAPLAGTFTSLGVIADGDGELRDPRLALRTDGSPLVLGTHGNSIRGYQYAGAAWTPLDELASCRRADVAIGSDDAALALCGLAGAGGVGVGQVEGFQRPADMTIWMSANPRTGADATITSEVLAAPLGKGAILIADGSEGALTWRAEADQPWVALPTAMPKAAQPQGDVRLATAGDRAVVAYRRADADGVHHPHVATWKVGDAGWTELPALGAMRPTGGLAVAASAEGTTAVLRSGQTSGCAIATLAPGATSWTEIGVPTGAPTTDCELRGFQLVGSGGKALWLAWNRDDAGLGIARWDGSAWHVAAALPGAPTTKVSLQDAALAASGALVLAWHAGAPNEARVSVGTFAPST